MTESHSTCLQALTTISLNPHGDSYLNHTKKPAAA